MTKVVVALLAVVTWVMTAVAALLVGVILEHDEDCERKTVFNR